ncbi:hypothetical protein EB796_006629 [Bugula neritina]|uniref:Oxysterol-binding protein n=1 Tax=Bugula neritina TaxID=10212 RepID=A0A7J7K8V9_BUGNE|nr:hypothetical protein EB796_006629 [Bugula neritina]
MAGEVNFTPDGRKQRKQSRSEWEIVGGLKDGEKYEERPMKFDGFLHKKRNPPLKGWHRRYFVLEEGILIYSKTPSDHQKGRHHGKIDVGLSVLSFNRRKKKIDIDSEDFVCHIRTKNSKWFEEWITNLKKHRLYRHNELSYGTCEAPLLTQITTEDEKFVSVSQSVPGGSLRGGSLPSQSKVIAWLIDNNGNEQCDKDLKAAQSQLSDLETLIEKLETQLPMACYHSHPHDLSPQLSFEAPKRGSISKILSFKSSHKKERRLADTVSSKSSASNPSLSSKFAIGDHDRSERPSSISSNSDSVQELKLCSEFISKSNQVYSLLKNLSRRIGTERDRLRHALQDTSIIQATQPATELYVQSLKQMLQEGIKQNEELKARLTNSEDTLGDSLAENFTKITLPPSPSSEKRNSLIKSKVNRSQSLSSKASELFFDATDYMIEETVDEEDNVSTVSSDSSSSSFSDQDLETGLSEEIITDDRNLKISEICKTGRRSTLPAPMSSSDTGLLSILTKNIGKDLTRISMPVTLNEPLNTLQILCEELEYSDLLDKASSFSDPFERMIYVAAFAVSSYASTNTRAATKPFNPILGETYECIRLDKGWKFVAEQVSHHPPISACHADSQNFIFKQDCRVKTKFWGKSMEIHPVGSVSVELTRHNEEYKWKKVTTCVHNVLGGQRWVDQYGEMNISCQGIKCKLNFVKASYWSNKKHEVHGTITGPGDEVKIYLFGKWTEALYCTSKTDHQSNRCIWRAGNLPEDHELYYGFTRFAVELNELQSNEATYLPRTDTRFRPDQRFLEEGKIDEAEAAKQRVEKLQREARKEREAKSIEYKPRWFNKVEKDKTETYLFNEDYWSCKREPGFDEVDNIPQLW